jgi:hypothetical protein
VGRHQRAPAPGLPPSSPRRCTMWATCRRSLARTFVFGRGDELSKGVGGGVRPVDLRTTPRAPQPQGRARPSTPGIVHRRRRGTSLMAPRRRTRPRTSERPQPPPRDGPRIRKRLTPSLGHSDSSLGGLRGNGAGDATITWGSGVPIARGVGDYAARRVGKPPGGEASSASGSMASSSASARRTSTTSPNSAGG